MQYNDDAIATNESMNNMREQYAQFGKTKILKADKNEAFFDNNQLYGLYAQEIETMRKIQI